MKLNFQILNSPIGELYLVANEKNLHAIIFKQNWLEYKKNLTKIEQADSAVLKATKKQLQEYFAGTRQTFDLPYELRGTDFQIRTWKSLAKVPYGKTKSYKEQAELAKAPNAVRAVGRTNGLNPLCIILPCHRIIGSNGKLTGYAGGLKAKEFLLKLEQTNKISFQ